MTANANALGQRALRSPAIKSFHTVSYPSGSRLVLVYGAKQEVHINLTRSGRAEDIKQVEASIQDTFKSLGLPPLPVDPNAWNTDEAPCGVLLEFPRTTLGTAGAPRKGILTAARKTVHFIDGDNPRVRPYSKGVTRWRAVGTA